MSNTEPRQTTLRRSRCGLGLLVLVAITAGCRQDMHDQPKYKPYRVFDDAELPRVPVEGTIARGQLKEDSLFFTGRHRAVASDKAGQQPAQPYADKLPVELNEALLNRGEERFNISCSPCHGRIGDGDGMVVRRGFRRPPSFHIDRLRNAPVGYIFDVITNGFGAMPEYSSQITPRDRWAIVAYVRALQLSQHATVEEVPAEARQGIGTK